MAGWKEGQSILNAQITIQQITNEQTKLIEGIIIGLLAGVGVGVLVKRTWGRFI